MEKLTDIISAISTGHYYKIVDGNVWGYGKVLGFSWDNYYKLQVLVDIFPHSKFNSQCPISIGKIIIESVTPSPAELFAYANADKIYIDDRNITGRKVIYGVLDNDDRIWSHAISATDDILADKHNVMVELAKKELLYRYHEPVDMDFTTDLKLLSGDEHTKMEHLVNKFIDGDEYTFKINGTSMVGSITKIRLIDNEIMVSLSTLSVNDNDLVRTDVVVKFSSIEDVTYSMDPKIEFFMFLKQRSTWSYIWDKSEEIYTKRIVLTYHHENDEVSDFISNKVMQHEGLCYSTPDIKDHPDVYKELIGKLVEHLHI